MGNKSSRSSRLNNTRGAVNVPNRQDVKDAISELPGTKVCVCVCMHVLLCYCHSCWCLALFVFCTMVWIREGQMETFFNAFWKSGQTT